MFSLSFESPESCQSTWQERLVHYFICSVIYEITLWLVDYIFRLIVLPRKAYIVQRMRRAEITLYLPDCMRIVANTEDGMTDDHFLAQAEALFFIGGFNLAIVLTTTFNRLTTGKWYPILIHSMMDISCFCVVLWWTICILERRRLEKRPEAVKAVETKETGVEVLDAEKRLLIE